MYIVCTYVAVVCMYIVYVRVRVLLHCRKELELWLKVVCEQLNTDYKLEKVYTHCTCIRTYVHASTYVYVCVRVCTRVYLSYVRTYVHACTCVYIHLRTYVY